MRSKASIAKAIRIVGVALVLVLASLLVVRVHAQSQRDALQKEFTEKLGPLDPTAYASPVVVDEDNAAIWLRAAAAFAFSDDDKGLIGDLTTTDEDEWTPEQRGGLHRILAHNAPALELVYRAGTMKQSSFGLRGTEKELKAKLPLLDLLWLQRLLYCEALQALASEDSLGIFWQAAGAMAVNAAAMEREAPLISQLVGVAAEKMLYEVVWEAVQSDALDQAGLTRLEATLPNVDLRATLRRSLASEAAGAWAPESQAIMEKNAPALAKEERLRIILDVADAIDQPFGIAGRNLEAAVEVPRSPQDLRATLIRAAGRCQTAMSLRRLARLSLELRRHALETGAYPDSLAAFPEATASDPFTGTMLGYERAVDGSARLTVPGAPELAETLLKPIKNWSHFTWELPAPTRKP